jgi:hypothetical protein
MKQLVYTSYYFYFYTIYDYNCIDSINTDKMKSLIQLSCEGDNNNQHTKKISFHGINLI